MEDPAGEERARLFVALELPADLRSALARWGSSVAGNVRGLRVLDQATLHVTLCFLGWRRVSEIPDIAAGCEVVAKSRASRIALGEGLWLPPRRPRVLAVRLEDEGERLVALQSALSSSLCAGGYYQPEKRPYLPHITVARAGRDARLAGVALPTPPALEFSAARVVLYRSRLAGGGARYEAQETVSLAPCAMP